MKTTLIHEWFVNYAGSERVVESFTNIWKDADIFALVDFLNPHEREIILKGKHANVSFIQKLPFAEKKHRNYLPLFPTAIERFNLSKYDVIISSSHAVAKGAITNKNQLHICYCHTPMRYAWDFYQQYLEDAGLEKGLKGFIAKRILNYVRKWDKKTANRPDYFIANSKYVSERIKRIYDRDSEVIYPPVDVNKFEPSNEKEKYYLTASRFVSYKKIDLVVEAFAKMPDKKLLVIGQGPEFSKIRSKATGNVELLGYKPTEELKEYMKKATAFVFAAEEDFGIIVVEAMAAGTPVIAFNKGGAAETVLDGKTGLLFDSQTSETICKAVDEFEEIKSRFNASYIRKHAEQFDRKIFEEKMKKFVDEKTELFYNSPGK